MTQSHEEDYVEQPAGLTSIEVATQQYLISRSYPSKRSVKNKSGRSGRKQQNGGSFQQLPGRHHVPHTSVGSLNMVRAVYGSTTSEYGAPGGQFNRGTAIVVPAEVGYNSDGSPNRL